MPAMQATQRRSEFQKMEGWPLQAPFDSLGLKYGLSRGPPGFPGLEDSPQPLPRWHFYKPMGEPGADQCEHDAHNGPVALAVGKTEQSDLMVDETQGVGKKDMD